MKRLLLLAGAWIALTATVAHALPGPALDWDPAYAWQTGATTHNLPAGGEFKMVGTISQFGPPFDFLNASNPSVEYTFYVYGLTSQGTVVSGDALHTFYTTNFTGGTIDVYVDHTPDAVFAPNPPNAQVPSTFVGDSLLLTGSFSSFVVQTNNFTVYNVGNIEGDIQWNGGYLLNLTRPGGSGEPCPGLFTGGSTWNPSVLIPGYLYRHDGKIDLQCPTATRTSTWGKIKSLYR